MILFLFTSWILGFGASGLAAEPPLQDLAIHAGADQPVYAEAEDGTILVSQAADHPVHPASVTKVATALALLRKLGPTHRFETKLIADGPVRDGVVEGNLVVQGGRDPFLVYEGACLLMRRLRERGIGEIRGDVLLRGPLLFNWQPDPDARRFAHTLRGREGASAWRIVAALPGAPVPSAFDQAALRVRGEPQTPGRETVLARHRSAPLLHIVKTLNGYSNNVFHLVSESIGGVKEVEAIAQESIPASLRDEVRIDNGAGAGTTNRMSARAAAALIGALGRELQRSGHQLSDALPVSGFDPGTLDERFLEQRGLVIGKTGTYGDVGASALAGAIKTTRYGVVRFAVLNSFVPVPQARKQQDAFVRALAEASGAQSWPYTQAVRPDFTAAEVE